MQKLTNKNGLTELLIGTLDLGAQHRHHGVIIAKHLSRKRIGDHLKLFMLVKAVNKIFNKGNIVLMQRILTDFNGQFHGHITNTKNKECRYCNLNGYQLNILGIAQNRTRQWSGR